MSQLHDITIAIAEDHPTYREGLKRVVQKQQNIVVTYEADNGRELLTFLEKNYVDIVLVDIEMNDIDGFETTKRIKELYPDIKVIAISMHKSEEAIFEMLAKGASGYLTKNADSKEIITGINSVYNGQVYFCSQSREIINKLIEQRRYHPHTNMIPKATEEEIAIIKLLAKGLSAKQISDSMKINQRTLEGIKNRLCKKFDVATAIEIVTYALKNKIIKLEDI